jgi:hypothetical protein
VGRPITWYQLCVYPGIEGTWYPGMTRGRIEE